MELNTIIEGRSCGSCTLCCKILSIAELNKPQGDWCRYALVGKGCSIYPDRPSECRTFLCGYLSWPVAGEHWQPAKCKMVIVSELDGQRIGVHVDPGRPSAWREQPFYDELKQMAKIGARDNIQVVVCIKNRAIVILPDRDVDLGPVADDERIVSGVTIEAGVERFEAYKMKADDPRIAGMLPGKLVTFRKPTIFNNIKR